MCAVAVLFDSDILPAADRADALISAMGRTAVASFVGPEDRDDIVSTRMDVWNFGTTSLFRAALSGIRLVRTPKQTKHSPSPNLAIAVQEIGEGLFDQGGEQCVRGVGRLHVTDENSPYEFSWIGRGASTALWVPLDELGLPDAVIRDASNRLHTSPIHDLVVNHIAALTRDGDELSADPAAAGLGTVSVELVRALLTSAAQANRYRRDALETASLSRIRGFVRKHLADPDLTPETIAAAHHISVRHLYKLCANADFSLHHWVTSRRLEGAREELAGLVSRDRSIAMIAQRWGFSNPTHFSRRFRAAYGMTPREWRQMSAADHLADSSEHRT